DVGETYWIASMWHLGDWRELSWQGEIVLREGIERGDVVSQLGARTGCNIFIWLVADRLDEARAQIAAAERALPAGFHLPHVLAIQAACTVDLYAGDIQAAADRLDQAWPAIERSGLLRIQQLRIELAVLRGQLALADGAR